ncbi:MAG: putative toxin-antitoxin system toxin component, PIN family [Candidatus Cryptobacteroides sp.]
MEDKAILAVIDTNVLVSGLLARNGSSAVVKVFEAVMHGRITPVICDEILSEYSDVLNRPKFRLPSSLVASILTSIRQNGIWSERVHIDEIFPDPKDVVFYEIAISKNDSYLVTGNIKHFPSKPFVVTPAEMLEILKNL